MVHGLVHAVFMRAVEQTVGVLHRGHARQTMLLGQAHKLGDAIRRFIGQAHGPHLACLDQIAQRLQLRMDGGDFAVFGGIEINAAKHGHIAGRPVQLVEVNHIGLQAAQAVVAGRFDVCGCDIHGAATNPGHAT